MANGVLKFVITWINASLQNYAAAELLERWLTIIGTPPLFFVNVAYKRLTGVAFRREVLAARTHRSSLGPPGVYRDFDVSV